ncbi:hypothetical protein AZE42_07102 [Rhizopogon vesiculosus]|uniref:Uncharacterized protein n=1 Tax=Rhizopogon vesiculosus TaxID=180088 RepID=A0A1J8QH39_9AGAM|nr:hypothetical protein AZE42_07102 [Rhizopogon vesiculosus]
MLLLLILSRISFNPLVRDAVSPQVGKIVEDHLKLFNETDLDMLNHCM